MNLPSGDMETEYAQLEFPFSVAVQVPEATSQSRTVLSSDPDAMNLPSGEMEIEFTLFECPFSVAVQMPEATSQSRTV